MSYLIKFARFNLHNLINLVLDTCVLPIASEWSDNFPYDFRDERMLKCLKEMTQIIVTIYPDLRRDVSILMHNLFSKVTCILLIF
jgi:hypothetical protein